MRTTSAGQRISTSLAGPGSGSSNATTKPTSCVDSTARGARNCGQITKSREIAISPQSRRRTRRILAEPLDDHRHALAAADAHGLQAELLVVGLQIVQQGGGD